MKNNWKNISIKKIAELAKVGTATVDRVLHNREGVKEKTKNKILSVLNDLNGLNNNSKKKIVLCCESGQSYNNTLKYHVEKTSKKKNNNIAIESHYIPAKEFKPSIFEKIILDSCHESDGLIIVSQEDTKIERALQKYCNLKKPVITLTTDFPSSGRTAYVGCEQSAAGATAAKLISNSLTKKKGQILMVMSMPYRCQQERELGFKKVLRSYFPKIVIKESVYSLDTSEESYKHVKRYIKDNGPPLGIYNIAGGNIGVAEAIKDTGFKNEVVFIGHELNQNSKKLLDSDEMSYVIGHDVKLEVEKSFSLINDFYNGKQIKSFKSSVLIYTKYNSLDYELIF
jgi:LacI family transcriptional regulator